MLISRFYQDNRVSIPYVLYVCVCVLYFKVCDSILRFIAMFINFLNTRPWEKIES